MDFQDECDINGEMELLSAIYMDDIMIKQFEGKNVSRLITMTLHPATGENTDEQLVCLTVEFQLPSEYPSVVPFIKFNNPRGLSDEHILSLRKELSKLSEDSCGSPMLYTLIEFIKESLSQTNIPYGQCVICLLDFTSEDQVTKTECYHYFHCKCLYRYIENYLQKIETDRKEALKNKVEFKDANGVICPVCRLSIKYDMEYLKSFAEIENQEEKYVITDDMRQLQIWMKSLFLKQLDKGGIIDLEAEKNKHLIVEGVTVAKKNNFGLLESENLDEVDSAIFDNGMKYSNAPQTSRITNEVFHKDNLKYDSMNDDKIESKPRSDQYSPHKSVPRNFNSSKNRNESNNSSNPNVKNFHHRRGYHLRGRGRGNFHKMQAPMFDDNSIGKRSDSLNYSQHDEQYDNSQFDRQTNFHRNRYNSSSNSGASHYDDKLASSRSQNDFKYNHNKETYRNQNKHKFPKDFGNSKSKNFIHRNGSASYNKCEFQKDNSDCS